MWQATTTRQSGPRRNVKGMARAVQVAIDCEDPERLPAFWAAVLHYRAGPTPDGASWPEHSRAAAVEPGEAWSKIVDPEGRGPSLHFHRVPETKVVKNRVHLDLRAPDDSPGDRRHQVDAEVERVVGLGARKVQGVTDEAGYFVVMQDPEGNEFCLG